MEKPPEEIECPECGDMMDQHGILKHPEGDVQAPAYSCRSCDQLFAFQDGVAYLTTFDAKGRLIEIECSLCGAVHNHKANLYFLSDDKWEMHAYCEPCAVQHAMADQLFMEYLGSDVKIEDVDVESLYAAYMTDKVRRDPEKLKFALENQRVMWRDLGMSDEKISERIEQLVSDAEDRLQSL